MTHTVEEDGDEVFTSFENTQCWFRIACGGAKLEKRKHDNNDSMHWRCPKCGGYYGAVQQNGVDNANRK